MKLELDNIELTFDKKRILHGVYIKIETGTITGILGRNGSGKTSLLRILFGDLKPKYKSIRKNEKHVKKELFKTNCVAYLPQHQLLPKNLRLKQAFRLFNVNWLAFIQEFNSFKLHQNSRVSQVSSGELRIIETYLILNSGKEIIILDEPFSFIAPVYIEKFKKIINQKKKTSAILISDHFYREILEISDSMYLLKNGSSKLIQSKQVLENEGYLNLESNNI